MYLGGTTMRALTSWLLTAVATIALVAFAVTNAPQATVATTTATDAPASEQTIDEPSTSDGTTEATQTTASELTRLVIVQSDGTAQIVDLDTTGTEVPDAFIDTGQSLAATAAATDTGQLNVNGSELAINDTGQNTQAERANVVTSDQATSVNSDSPIPAGVPIIAFIAVIALAAVNFRRLEAMLKYGTWNVVQIDDGRWEDAKTNLAWTIGAFDDETGAVLLRSDDEMIIEGNVDVDSETAGSIDASGRELIFAGATGMPTDETAQDVVLDPTSSAAKASV